MAAINTRAITRIGWMLMLTVCFIRAQGDETVEEDDQYAEYMDLMKSCKFPKSSYGYLLSETSAKPFYEVCKDSPTDRDLSLLCESMIDLTLDMCNETIVNQDKRDQIDKQMTAELIKYDKEKVPFCRRFEGNKNSSDRLRSFLPPDVKCEVSCKTGTSEKLCEFIYVSKIAYETILAAEQRGGGNVVPNGGNTGPNGGNGGPSGGNTGPNGGNTGPNSGNTGPSGGNTGPNGGNTGPIGGPNGGNTGPNGGNTGPSGGNTGPSGGNTGPNGGNTGPNGGPSGGNTGPNGGNTGPSGGNTGPNGGNGGPSGGNTGPNGGNTGPNGGPSGGNTGPYGGNTGPSGGNTGPNGGPSGGNTGPNGGNGGPSGGNTGPNGGNVVPNGGNVVPYGGNVVPNGGPSGGNTGPSGGNTGPNGGNIGPNGGNTGPNGGNVVPNGGLSGGNTGPNGGNFVPNGGNTGPSGGNTGPNGGNTGPNGGNTGPNGGNVVPNGGPSGGNTGPNGGSDSTDGSRIIESGPTSRSEDAQKNKNVTSDKRVDHTNESLTVNNSGVAVPKADNGSAKILPSVTNNNQNGVSGQKKEGVDQTLMVGTGSKTTTTTGTSNTNTKTTTTVKMDRIPTTKGHVVGGETVPNKDSDFRVPGDGQRGQPDVHAGTGRSPELRKKLEKEYDAPSSGNFMAYFLTAVVLCIAGYVVFHNKQKIIAFIIEGRSGRGRRRTNGGAEYKKLQSNVEEVMPSLDKSTSAKNFIY